MPIQVRAALQLQRIGVFLCALLLSCAGAPAHAATAADDFLRLAEKLPPGLPSQDAEALLGPPLESHPVGGDADLIRKSWLHGETGIEIHFLKDAAYRVELSRRFERNIDLLRTLDALTRQGQQKYGVMPRFDTARNEYYWISQDRRLSFARQDAGTLCVRHRRHP